MLLSRTEEEQKSAYNDACAILVDKPLKLEKSPDYFDRSAYYVGYYVKCIPGYINVNGSAPFETNHSSVTARFGGSGAWTSISHLHSLIETTVLT